MRFRSLARTAVAVAAASFALGATPASAQEPMKVGFVYVSPIGDAGWTYQHDQGRKEMEKALAGKVVTKYVENVPEGADAERVIRDLATSGHRLIYTTSFGYMNPTEKVAKQFPNVTFEHATGYKRGKNMGTYNARFYEARYLAGIVAGRMTKSNVAGYVAAFPIPEVLQGINAFTLGMRSVNPKAETKVIWVNSWYDPGKEREAANTLIAQGADVVTHHTDSPAVVQAAQEKKVYAVGYHSDMSKYGPQAHLTAAIHLWGPTYTMLTKEVLDGTWKSRDIWGGIREGMVDLAPINPIVPKDVVELVAQKKQAIRDGKFQPFGGPVKDQSGAVRVPAGQSMPDDKIALMDYYVEGVQGQLPKKQ
jgi:simple sugar transport system substrate-binding protein